MIDEAWIETIAAQTGSERVEVPPEWAELVPATVQVVPPGVEALQGILAAANERRCPVYPVGGGTSLAWGLPGEEPGLALSLRGINGVVDYPARDMTITVRAGNTVSEVQETLARERQRLPIDVPNADTATIGGAVAANVSGPRRFGFGTFRDYVIGIGVVTADGKLARAGGRVVKNVAGYDLCKLYTGSFGSLAIIVELTFKVHPMPEKTEAVLVGCSRFEDVEAVLAGSLRSRTRPVVLELLNRSAWQELDSVDLDRDWSIAVVFEGFEEAVAWQVETFLDEVRRWTDGRARAEVVHSPNAASLVQSLASFTQRPTPVLAKLNYRPSMTVGLLEELSRLRGTWLLSAHANNGIAWLAPAAERSDGEIVDELAQLRRWAVSADGNLVVRGASFCARTGFAPWGVERGDTWLMRRLKQRFDPHGILNRGRFVDHPRAVEPRVQDQPEEPETERTATSTP